MKKYFFIAGLFLVVLTAALGWFYQNRQTTPLVTTPTPTPLRHVSFRNLTPGQSTKEDVVHTLGAPIRQDQTGQETNLIYSSGINQRPVIVSIDEGQKVSLVVEPVAPQVRLSQLTEGHGEPDVVLYGAYHAQGFQLRAYLQKGTAFLANPKTGEVKQRWYFPPMTLGQFQTIASGFFLEPISEDQQ